MFEPLTDRLDFSAEPRAAIHLPSGVKPWGSLVYNHKTPEVFPEKLEPCYLSGPRRRDRNMKPGMSAVVPQYIGIGRQGWGHMRGAG